MEHPKAVGDRTTLAIMLALKAADFTVLLPFGKNSRYDLVIDDGDRLSRVQCKTGRLRAGAIRFAACSSYAHHRRRVVDRRDYHGQVDFFAAFCPETEAVYLVPIEDLPVRVQGALRVAPVLNNQRQGVRLAADYEIAVVSLAT